MTTSRMYWGDVAYETWNSLQIRTQDPGCVQSTPNMTTAYPTQVPCRGDFPPFYSKLIRIKAKLEIFFIPQAFQAWDVQLLA